MKKVTLEEGGICYVNPNHIVRISVEETGSCIWFAGGSFIHVVESPEFIISAES